MNPDQKPVEAEIEDTELGTQTGDGIEDVVDAYGAQAGRESDILEE